MAVFGSQQTQSYAMQPDDQEIADAICAYLEEHPFASDTIAGIAHWWIARQKIRAEVERVTLVVEHLTAMGILESVRIGGDVAYRLAPNPPVGRHEQ